MKREEVLEVIVEGCFSYRLWGACSKIFYSRNNKTNFEKTDKPKLLLNYE
ncbi:hypothetical protein [Viridibacillus arvi]